MSISLSPLYKGDPTGSQITISALVVVFVFKDMAISLLVISHNAPPSRHSSLPHNRKIGLSPLLAVVLYYLLQLAASNPVILTKACEQIVGNPALVQHLVRQ